MLPRVKSVPNLTDNSPRHQKAILDGNEHFKLWQRNVIDKFKEKSNEEIKQSLKKTAFPFAVLLENWVGDYNISCGMRNANAFNAKEIFYIGDKRLDRRGCVGVHNYSDITWLSSLDELIKLKEKYVFIGVDNIDGAIPIDNYQWPNNALMIFGSEGVGLTPTMQSLCKELVYIKQFGSVRSLNAATASGIIMHDFVSKYKNQ